MAEQIKSRQRVTDHGEVMTAEREVNAMLDLVGQETVRVDSRFLEPACGDGNFLAEILRRKLRAAQKRATAPRQKKPQPGEFERQSVIACASIYGVDLLKENVEACIDRLYKIWDEHYRAACGASAGAHCCAAVRFILSRNIVCGNALTMKQVDDNRADTAAPIIFSEWSFITGDKMQRRDFRFDRLLAGDYSAAAQERKKEAQPPAPAAGQPELFADAAPPPDGEGELLAAYITDYRKVHTHAR